MLALALALATTPAHALDCADWYVQGSMPADTATAVPTNAQITVFVYAWSDVLEDPYLLDDGGSPVTTTVERHDAGTQNTFVLTPSAALDANASYSVSIQHPFNDGPPQLVATFTTGDQTDTTAPSVPNIDGVTATHETDEWGDWRSFIVDGTVSTDDNAVKYEVTVVDDTATTGTPTFVRWQREAGDGFHDDPCNSDEVALLNPEDTTVTIRAIDVAGNASDGTTVKPDPTEEPTDTGDTGEPEPAETGDTGDGNQNPTTSGGRCSVVSGAGAGAMFMLLPLVGLRRRQN